MIVHLDADAFFASVEQAADVRLRRGKSLWQWAAQKEELLPVPATRRDDLASTPPCPPPKRGNFARASSPFRAIRRNMRNLVVSCFPYAYE